MLPPLLLKGKTGGMSGGHAKSLTAVNTHEVQNIVVSLLSFLRKKRSVSKGNEPHNCWLFRCHFSQCPCFLKYFELTVSTEHYCLCTQRRPRHGAGNAFVWLLHFVDYSSSSPSPLPPFSVGIAITSFNSGRRDGLLRAMGSHLTP
jgi:hypothetical protein